MRRTGHDTIDTTMGYVKIAEDLSGNLGAPFAALPAELINPCADEEASAIPIASVGPVEDEGVLAGSRSSDPEHLILVRNESECSASHFVRESRVHARQRSSNVFG
jgi:hypothetical protein